MITAASTTRTLLIWERHLECHTRKQYQNVEINEYEPVAWKFVYAHCAFPPVPNEYSKSIVFDKGCLTDFRRRGCANAQTSMLRLLYQS